MASSSPDPPHGKAHSRLRLAAALAGAAFGLSLAVALVALGVDWRSTLAGFALVVAAAAATLLALYARRVVGSTAEALRLVRRYAAGETQIRLDPGKGIAQFRDLATTINEIADRIEDRDEQYALVAEATGDVIWQWRAATNRVVWTGEVRRHFGVATDRHEAESAWWHARIHPQDRDRVEKSLERMMAGTARHWSEEYRFRHENGTYRWFWDRGVTVRDASGEPIRFIGCMTDISARRAAEERIWQLANQDELTGLPNRKVFQSRLNTLADTSGQTGCSALLLIDIDHFKDVNDSLGHPAGDALLRLVGARLKDSAGAAGAVFRLGGDEFAVIMPAFDRRSSTALAGRVLSALRDPVVVADQMVTTGATIGIVLFPDHGRDPETLLQNADLALYEGKARGRSQAVLFEPTLRRALETRITLMGEVRAGLEKERFRPYYQPIVSLRTGIVHGVEALMRWEHPEKGLITPGTFMAAYDDPDLALRLGTRLLQCVLADYRALEGAGLAPSYIAVNVSSAVSRLPDLADRVLARLAEEGMPASRLCVELTETLLFGEHAELIGATVRQLHAAGVRIALDDFGTGYASLTHLQKFPVDAIKIDQSFVSSIATDPGSQAITSAVLELGRRLGKDVVAEGVETAEHAEILRAAGCRQAQGYYFARPMPPEALMEYLEQHRGGAEPVQAIAG